MPLLDAQPKRTSYAEILLAVKARLVAVTLLPAVRVKILTNRSQVPHLQAEQMLFLRPGRWISPRSQRDGEGRVAARVYRYMNLLVANRVALDTVDEDEIMLTSSTYGIIGLEELCQDALDQFWPEDSDQNVLTFEPMRHIAEQEERKTSRPFWCDCLQTYEVGYLPPFSSPLST